MNLTLLIGAVLTLAWSGSVLAQSRNEQAFGPWKLTTIVDVAAGPTRAILSTSQAQSSGRPGQTASLTFRCRSDQPAKMDAIFSATESLSNRSTHPVTFHFDADTSMTQAWASRDEYGSGLNGAAYNYVAQDVSALLQQIAQSRQLSVNAATFIGRSISTQFTFPSAETETALRVTRRACEQN